MNKEEFKKQAIELISKYEEALVNINLEYQEKVNIHVIFGALENLAINIFNEINEKMIKLGRYDYEEHISDIMKECFEKNRK